MNNQYYTARCLGDLGCVAYHQGDYHQAEQRLQQALNLWTNIGHGPYRAWVCSQLGYVMDGAIDNRPATARQYYRQALQLATKHNLAPFVLDVFVGVAGLLARTG